MILPLVVAAGFLLLLVPAGRARFFAELPSWPRRITGAALLAATLAACVFEPALSEPIQIDPDQVWFPGVFVSHVLLAVCLTGWWLLAGRPAADCFLWAGRPQIEDLRVGFGLGMVAWAAGVSTSVAAAFLLGPTRGGPLQDAPAIVVYLGTLPVWRKCLLIGAAMLVEEAFFRGFLQPRVGWVISSLLFALAHAGYGLPVLAAGVLAVSVVLAWGLQRTRRLWPCMIAHGTFDAVQLFVVIPTALRYGPAS